MKVSVELEDLVRLAGMQHAEPEPMPAEGIITYFSFRLFFIIFN